jgi:uncharacterized membrane protein YeaQ/YmgE (transglycosylase-associated protein family)
MGIALWLGSALAAWILARIVPIGTRGRLWIELIGALSGAFLAGVVATALDFGGWRELEWRAALLAFLGAVAALGALRALRGIEN